MKVHAYKKKEKKIVRKLATENAPTFAMLVTCPKKRVAHE